MDYHEDWAYQKVDKINHLIPTLAVSIKKKNFVGESTTYIYSKERYLTTCFTWKEACRYLGAFLDGMINARAETRERK